MTDAQMATSKHPERNGLNRILAGVAILILAAVIIGGVVLYADVQRMKGNRYTAQDGAATETRLRQEFSDHLTTTEIQLKEEWLEGIRRIEAAIEQLRQLHLGGDL